ncbi:hypothetical protein PRUPE_7G165000 [Prunus persica]|uniref:Zinc finger CCCH domain-containing protein 44 n=1 Tax=Prunus persica TaxID=3760 RepID=A0A251NCG8_PRUPE|nr:zinc finger CCCH domain-containing protein 44 [Prunus persica]ONH97021.1 hypothetical protein PRUPE_7G165000 [Prunus persica]
MELQKAQLSSTFYRPSLEEDGGGGRGEQAQPFDRSLPTAEDRMSVDQCEAIGDLDDSRLVGAPQTVAGGGMVAGRVGQMMADVAVKVAGEKSLGKRRRGRPPSGHVRATPVRKQNEEEDVCFICFDGGSLVLCDRRGCPKAYHPSCIKRDESFFKSKAKWNCGWHICSSCQKASHYWCYTCTYSLCKGCTKDADYQCVRGNKGFCGTCMRTIMLIENVQGNKEVAQVDFDDKSSWEYLFKVYWNLLKGKLSLTLDELINAKNPWKGPAVVVCKRDSSGELYNGDKTTDSISLNSFADLEATHSKRSNKKPRISNKDLTVEKSLGGRGMPFSEGTVWASKELLAFVAHMKNGDISVLSQFDVQALLLEYIKKNSLRDPRRKCQIVCDSRLINLFGKECVGHFEMLKLLESHFLIKESSRADNISSAAVVTSVSSQMEFDGIHDNQMMMGNDKRRKTRKRVDEKGPQTNPAAYAAIDVHNINLIYLRRNWMEILIEDIDKFHEKVVGSVVRIRISSGDQKQEIYRLVQVIGTIKVAKPYKIGTRTTDVKLEILNLDKKEVISIDEISNQEFTQDECKRLRQSIRCGLTKRLTVGEIQEKAMALQAVRVNDLLEAEVLRLNHLRDRASEKGHRKELRECVEKLQLLNSPEERQRRLNETQEVHPDPSMDPSYESEDNAGDFNKKQDDKVKPRKSVFSRKGREPFPQPWEGDISNNIGGKAQKNRGRETFGINGCSTIKNQVNPTGLTAFDWNNQSVVESNTSTELASEISSLPLSAVMKTDLSVDNFETDKIWHYHDPTGKIQGPFAMIQLRKWSTTGHFPLDHRIWRINEKPDDSILLADAVNGQYYKEPLLPHDSHLLSQGFTVAMDERNNGQDAGSNKSMNATEIDGKKVEESWNTKQDGQSLHNNGNVEPVRCSTPVDVVNSNEEQTGNHLQGQDPLKGNSSSPNKAQESGSLPSPVVPVKPYETLEGESRGAENNSDQNNGNLDPPKTAQGQIMNGQCTENRSDSEGHSGQSSGQNWRPPPVSSPSNGCDSNSDLIPLSKSCETSEQDQRELSFPDIPSRTPKPSNGDLLGQAAENKQSVSSNFPVQDSGPSWSTASSLGGGGAQLPEVGGEWGGYSPTPAKPTSLEEWESSLVSASSLKPSEMAGDCVATAVSVSGQLTHSSPSHPTSNASGWQDILTGSTEFCTLAGESVSDLLAEVEAMESLSGLATPTSIMNCGGEFTEGSKNESISSVEGFSPPDPGKGDALSSSGDLRVPMVTDEPLGECQGNAVDLQKGCGVHSSTSAEVEGDRKPSDVSVNQWEAGPEIQNTAPPKENWDIASTDNHWKARSESTETSWEAAQGNANMGWGGSEQGGANTGWGGGQGIAQGNTSINPGTPAGAMLESQSRYGGDRFIGPRDRGFQNRDIGFGRGRFQWNRQTYGNGGGSFRPPPKSQRVCKYYESGYCKKGASCGYLHP